MNLDNNIDYLFDEDCSMEQFRERYIYENREPQLENLDKWLDEIINTWSGSYLSNNSASWNERVLLGIYICNFFRLKGNYMLSATYKDSSETLSDKLFDILDNFPNTDALDEVFVDDLKDSADNLYMFIENILVKN